MILDLWCCCVAGIGRDQGRRLKCREGFGLILQFTELNEGILQAVKRHRIC